MNYEFLANKSVLIFLPHQDDEMNLVYGLLDGIKKLNCKVKIVYSTNGDYVVDAKYRIKEALDALKVVGIKKENVIFMGYSDQAFENDSHLYHSKEQWISQKNISKTYTPYNNDYHFLKFGEHATFNHDNFVDDIYHIMKDELADVLICVDFDSHPDHRALSLSFEKALGKVLKESSYRPKVYKNFAYPTSYKGESDFAFNNSSTKNKVEEFGLSPMQNPFYDWNERLRFRQSSKSTKYALINNVYFWGLLKHKSQYILNVYDKVINSDIVFFERVTDNLLFDAVVETSSGDSSFLNDFMLFDCSNIMHGDEMLPKLDEGFTIFDQDDSLKKINITFKENKNFNCVKIFTALDSCEIDEIVFTYNEKSRKFIPRKVCNAYLIEDDFSAVRKMEIKLNSKSGFIKIGEIEIRQTNEVHNTYAKLMINDNFVYEYYDLNEPNFEYYTDYDKENLLLIKHKNRYILKSKLDGKVLDEVILRRSKMRACYIRVIHVINKVLFFAGRVYQKLIKMKRKVLSKRKSLLL